MKETIHQLDGLRTKERMTIKHLTDGIISERMYRRYMHDESDLPYPVFAQLVKRLGYTVPEFVTYVQQKLQLQHHREHVLANLILEEKFDEAYDYYQANNFAFLQSRIRYKFLPVLIHYMSYQVGLITKHEYRKHARAVLNIPEILSHRVLTREDVEALLIHMRMEDDETVERLAFFLLLTLEDPERDILTFEPEVTRSHIYSGVASALLNKMRVYHADLVLVRHYLKELANLMEADPDLPVLRRFIANVMILHEIEQNQNRLFATAFYLFAHVFSQAAMPVQLKDLFTRYEHLVPTYLTILADPAKTDEYLSLPWRELI
jgi:hypothetical protein